MSTIRTLKIQARERTGTGGARAARRDGLVPGIVYGGKGEPLAIAIEVRELDKAIAAGRFSSTLFEIDVAGAKLRVVPRAVQFHPVTDRPIHFDLMRLEAGSKITVSIPVRFINQETSPGLKRGGVLNIVRHDLELVCDADKIPDEIAIDVTGFDVGDSIHISHVTLPKGVESAITDRDFTIATIVAPSALKSTGGDTTKDDGEAADA